MQTLLKNKTIKNFQDIIFFLSLLFIGSDLMAFKFFGLTIRYVNVIIVIGFLLTANSKYFRYNYPKNFFIASIFLLISMTTSIINSYDIYRTIAYIAWFVFFIIVMVPYYYNYVLQHEISKIFKILIITFRVQVIFLIIEAIYTLLNGEFIRPHIWFYEPSYAAIYLSVYLGISLYLKINHQEHSRLDFYLSCIGLLILISATALFAILSGILITILTSKSKIKYFLFSIMSLTISILLLYLLIGDTEYYKLLFGFFEYSEGFFKLLDNILFRSGTRVIRLIWGFDAFTTYPFTGIGFGADQTYTQLVDIPVAAEAYVTPWDSAWGNPFVNPFIEAAGTMGILGLLSVTYICYSIINLYVKVNKLSCIIYEKNIVLATVIGLIVLIIALQMEGTFLRYYLWSTYAIILGLVKKLKFNNEIINTHPNT